MRTVVGLVIIIAIVVVIAVLLWQRRGRDEIHSIDSYRNALDTLQEMRGPAASASVRVLDQSELEELRQPHPTDAILHGHFEEPEKVTAVGPPPAARDGMVFSEEIGRAERAADQGESRGHEAPTWAIERMQSRPRFENRQIIVGAIAGVAIVAIVVIGALIGSSSSSNTKSTTTTHPHASTTRATSTTTSTSAPKVTSYQPESSTATSATYAIPGSSFEVTIKATTGPCWTIVTASNGGAQLFAGSIQPGSPQVIKATSSIDISLGAPALATVSVGGIPVDFPQGFSTPLVLTLAPSTSTTPTTGSAPTTTTTVPVTTTTQAP